jgi:hypothetical protein
MDSSSTLVGVVGSSLNPLECLSCSWAFGKKSGWF